MKFGMCQWVSDLATTCRRDPLRAISNRPAGCIQLKPTDAGAAHSEIGYHGEIGFSVSFVPRTVGEANRSTPEDSLGCRNSVAR